MPEKIVQPSHVPSPNKDVFPSPFPALEHIHRVNNSIGEIFGSGPGKSTGKSTGINGKGTNFPYRDNIEVDPTNPLVTIKMDDAVWINFMKKSGENCRVEPDEIHFQIGEEFAMITTVVFFNKGELTLRILPRGLINTGVTSNGTIDYDFRKNYEKSLLNLIKKNLLKNNLLTLRKEIIASGDGACDIEIQTEDTSENGVQELLKKWKQASAIVIEVISRSIFQDTPITVNIPKPRISEKSGSHPSIRDLLKGGSPSTAEIEEKINAMEVTESHCTLSDIGGYPELKQQVKQLIAQYNDPEFFRKRGVTPPRGVLLFGPPGTGKTLTAKAMAGEMACRFYHVKASDILSKFYSESEETLRNIFKHVKGPCILFIDEIDSIGENRDTVSEPTKRVLTELLQQIDGMTSRKDIMLVAATNRKDALDPALLRAGRLDRHLLVGLPDIEARAQIWDIHINKARRASETPLFEEEINISRLAKNSDGNVGADLEAVVKKVLEKITYESYTTHKDLLISTQMLLDELALFQKEKEIVSTLSESSNWQPKIGFLAQHSKRGNSNSEVIK